MTSASHAEDPQFDSGLVYFLSLPSPLEIPVFPPLHRTISLRRRHLRFVCALCRFRAHLGMYATTYIPDWAFSRGIGAIGSARPSQGRGTGIETQILQLNIFAFAVFLGSLVSRSTGLKQKTRRPGGKGKKRGLPRPGIEPGSGG